MYEHLADFLSQSPRSANAEKDSITVTPIFFVVIFQVSLVLVFMVGVIVYKLLVYRPLASNPSTRARAQQIANVTGAFVNLTIIMILSRVGTAAKYSQLMFGHQ